MSDNRLVPEKQLTPPKERKPILVQTEGFQCMAYQDCHGKWRNFYNLELLPGKVEPVKDLD